MSSNGFFENDDLPTHGLIADGNSFKSGLKRKSSVISRDVTGTELIYYNIDYVVPVKEKKVKFNKSILKGCSGIMRPGLNAIMGPTGSGKTTLLDILAGRKDKKYLNGHVLVNGLPQTNDFRLSSGFVVQDDVVMGTLTVRENLFFSANLRLPSSFGYFDRKARVEMIIKDLGLTFCADTLVGVQNRRGISGGERKRTCIGMELVISPDVLFLDEPTTGLDASTAVVVMKLLRRQAAKGRTIIFSIHQPRYTIFKLFDHLTLLTDGQIVYNGLAKQSMQYFESLGYKCETYNNPADFYMDVLSEKTKAVEGIYLNEPSEESLIINTPKKSLVEVYEMSEMFIETMKEINPAIEASKGIDEVDTRDSVNRYPSSFFRQLKVLSGRSGRNLIRDPRGITSQLFVVIVYGLITGAIYWKLNTKFSGLQNRVGVFYFILMNQVFSNLSAVAIFINERPIFRNECSNGYYRVSAYFLAKLFFDVIPLRLIPLIAFSLLVYFMTGLQVDVAKFFIFILALLTANLTGSSICIFVSSSTNNLAIANIFVTLPFVFMQVFSGFLLNLNDITPVLRWLQYLSIFRYSLSTLEINELQGLVFSECGQYKNQTCTGDSYLDQQGIKPSDLWPNQFVLIGLTAFLYFASYLQLRRMKKTV